MRGAGEGSEITVSIHQSASTGRRTRVSRRARRCIADTGTVASRVAAGSCRAPTTTPASAPPPGPGTCPDGRPEPRTSRGEHEEDADAGERPPRHGARRRQRAGWRELDGHHCPAPDTDTRR